MIRRIFPRLNWKYTLGELALIVFGILIALQIDNCNDRYKERQFEKKILREIKTALEGDLDHIQNRVNRCRQIRNSADVLYRNLTTKAPYRDSLQAHFERLDWQIIFELKTAPFETLRSKGIETVSNDSLRIRLLELYDYTYPRKAFFTDSFNQFSASEITPFLLRSFQLSPDEYTPLDYEFLSRDAFFHNIIFEKWSSSGELLWHLGDLKRKVEETLKWMEH